MEGDAGNPLQGCIWCFLAAVLLWGLVVAALVLR